MPETPLRASARLPADSQPWLFVINDVPEDRQLAGRLIGALEGAGYVVAEAVVPAERAGAAADWEETAARIAEAPVVLYGLTASSQDSSAFLAALAWGFRCADITAGAADGQRPAIVVPVELEYGIAAVGDWLDQLGSVTLPRHWTNNFEASVALMTRHLPEPPNEADREAARGRLGAPASLPSGEEDAQRAAHEFGRALALGSERSFTERAESEDGEDFEALYETIEDHARTAAKLARDAGDTALNLAIRLELEHLVRPGDSADDEEDEEERTIKELHAVAREAAEAGLHRLEAIAQLLLGKFALEGSEFTEARAHLRSAYALAQRHNLPQELARAQLSLGDMEAAADNHDAAVRHWQDAAEAFAAYGDLAEQASILLTAGTTLSGMARDDEASAAYNQATALYRSLGDVGGEASLQNNLGQTARWLGQYDVAHKRFREAERLFESVGETDSVRRVRHNIARTFLDEDNPEDALTLLQQNLDEYTTDQDLPGIARTLRDMGLAHEELGDEDKALAEYERGLALLQQVDDENSDLASRPWVLASMGKLYAAKGEFDRAIEAYEAAANVAEAVFDDVVHADAAFHRSLLAVNDGELDVAVEWAERAVEAAETVAPDELTFDMRDMASLMQQLAASRSLGSYFDDDDDDDDDEDESSEYDIDGDDDSDDERP